MKLIWQLWYIFNVRERVEGSILLAGMSFGALLEALSISLVAPFVAGLNAPARIFGASIARPVLAALNIRTQQDLLVTLGLGLIIVFVLKSVYLALLYRWLFRFVYGKHVSITRQLLTGYLGAPYVFHLQRNTAELIKGTTDTIQRFINGFLTMLLIVLAEVLVVVALSGLLLFINPLATVGVALLLGVPTALIYRMMQRRLAASGRLADLSMTSMIKWTEQASSGIKETLIMDRTSFFVDQHIYHTRRYAESWCSFTIFSNVPRLITDTLAIGSLVVISLIILARGQDLQSVLPLLGVFTVAALRLMPSMNRIAYGLTQLRFHYVTVEVLHSYLKEVETQSAVARRHAGPDKASPSPLPFARSLVLEQLCYRYPSMPQLAVDDVSLEIPKGAWVAFIGPTGAGKTTLVDLLLGLFVPSSGTILVDGRNIFENVAAWQRNIGYVPQDVYLLDDTVRHNVAYGLPDEEIDDERVWQSLGAAEVEKFVRSLPDGLNAMIGQRGDRLSGGECQRLGLARALYRDPQVLVIDEGTANLDAETEAAIVHTLSGLRGKKTIIVIAHRLPLVRNSDHVYLLRQGKVHNSGAYPDLMQSDAEFRQFVHTSA